MIQTNTMTKENVKTAQIETVVAENAIRGITNV
jgi:cobalamin biosynthesis protein CobD/CbiB